MEFDLQKMAAKDRYKLLVGLVVPRPIALVTTFDENGVVNAAPFSFFNVMGSNPPIIAFGPSWRPDGSNKDTPQNIRLTGEFVINLVDEDLAPQMNICATDFPQGESEIEAAGLELAPSIRVHVPRLAASPAQLECREHCTIEIGKTRVVLGEVLHLRIRDDLINPEKLYVAGEKMHLIGRMHGPGGYTRTRDYFEIPRLSYEEWKTQNDG